MTEGQHAQEIPPGKCHESLLECIFFQWTRDGGSHGNIETKNRKARWSASKRALQSSNPPTLADKNAAKRTSGVVNMHGNPEFVCYGSGYIHEAGA